MSPLQSNQQIETVNQWIEVILYNVTNCEKPLRKKTIAKRRTVNFKEETKTRRLVKQSYGIHLSKKGKLKIKKKSKTFYKNVQ